MRTLLAFVLATTTTCVASDLKVKMVARPANHNSVPQQMANDQACQNAPLCVSVPDVPGIHEETIYVHGSGQRVEFQGTVMGQGPYVFSMDPGLVLGPGEDRIILPPVSGDSRPLHWVPGPALPPGHYRAMLPHMAVITHCDTGVVIELDLDSHEYREFKQPKYPSEDSYRKEVERATKDAHKRVRWSMTDTSETKEFFGYTAKHQITSIEEKVLLRSHHEIVDGWYIDLPQPGCAPEYLRDGQAAVVTFNGPFSTDILTSCNCLDPGSRWAGYWAYSTLHWAEGYLIPVGFREITPLDYQFGQIWPVLLYVGFTPRGLAVDQTITGEWESGSFGETKRRGTEKALETKITELSDAPLDPALFEVPPRFYQG